MSIRVICPSCGRKGRVPEEAIGRNVRCPVCSQCYRFTADMALPEGGDPAPKAPPRVVRPTERPAVRPPVAPAPAPAEGARRGGLVLPLPALIGGAVGVAVLAIGLTWAVIGMSRGQGKAPVADASAKAPAASTKATTTTAVAAGGMSTVGAATGGAATLADPEEDPALAAQARAAAAGVAARDEGAGRPMSTADIVAESEPSVALVKGKLSSGTGFLVAPGLLATNSHVIDDEFVADLEVRFVSADDAHKGPVKAQLLYEDPARDLALLAVRTDLKPLRVARSYTFRKGEDITVIGCPARGDGEVLENAISRGVMSTKTQIDGRSFYQLGMAVNPGNSGGPVFDSTGRVVGVVTLKSTKQEATSFSVPIEDLHAALGKLANQTATDADGYRSRHRLKAAVKGLGSGGALMCLVIDLRRAAAATNDSDVKELLGKLEPIVGEVEKEAFPSLAEQAPRAAEDAQVDRAVRDKLGELNENFGQIRAAYAGGNNVDDNQLRPLKQAHKRLITELFSTLKLEVPKGMLTAFDDHAPGQRTIVMVAPGGLGAFGSRLRPRPPGVGLGVPRPPLGMPRPPMLNNRLRGGGRR